MTPPVVLVAQDEDKDKEIAKLKAQHEEDEKKAKADHEEMEKMKARIATDLPPEKPATPGPVVKAIFAQMDEEERKQARIEAETAVAQEDDPEKKAAMQKAMEEIFDTGNGVNTNARKSNLEDEEEKTATLKALTAKVARPIINEILTAKTKAGATEEEIAAETKRLTAMTLPQIEQEYKNQEIFIKQSLVASDTVESSEALTARYEKSFEFNGVTPLTANAIDIDAALEAATQ